MGNLLWIWLALVLMPIAVLTFRLALSVWWGLVKGAIAWCFGATDEEQNEQSQ